MYIHVDLKKYWCIILYIILLIWATVHWHTSLVEELEVNIHHASTPATGLLKMFESQLHTDVTFQVAGQRVCAHRIVLASQSDYFDCLLYGPMMEGRASEITLKETPAEAFKELLKFAYSGSISSINLTVRTLVPCSFTYIATIRHILPCSGLHNCICAVCMVILSMVYMPL